MPSPRWPTERPISENLDSQGRVVVHSLEYTIIYQCVNRCRACNHFTFIQPEHAVKMEQFEEDLVAMARIAHCDKFSIIGGECLLHPKIVDLLDIANEVGIGDVVSLTSNGQLIDKFDARLWSRLQRIEFGLYAGKGWTVPKLNWLMDAVEAWGLPAFFGLVGPHDQLVADAVRFRVEKNPAWAWSRNPGFHPTLTRESASEQEAQRRFARCLYGHVCVTMDQGYVFRCPQSSFVPGLLLGEEPTTDGRLIEGMSVQDFLRFVSKEDHLCSCHRCCSLENYFPWSEVPEDITPDAWLEQAMGG